MLVKFVTDHEMTDHGFSAKIHHTAINQICKDWLNITTGFLTLSDHPTMDCSLVITASMGSTISIQFHIFEVLDDNISYLINVLFFNLLH